MNKTTRQSHDPDDGRNAVCCGFDEFVVRLKALGHPVRMQIVNQLLERDRCCRDFCACMPLAQSTISQHLDLLCKAGLVDYRPQGNRSRYSLNRTAFEAMARAMADMARRQAENEAAEKEIG
ncbi:MAG: metalloregulator ArsR/SmtB family transcription factor [Salaquimonas sp.]|nr:metalloregulator ArsR/SmtB family transcription factor [Salaquimonas sp.]